MSKYSFLDDYSEGCHPQILQALSDTNLVQQTAYGDDQYCIEAKQLIRDRLAADSSIYFVGGGTLANIIITASCLRSHEAVIAPSIGHIVVRETGAIEATGHKIITVATDDGKLTPGLVRNAVENNAHFPHMARPRLVYISNATEIGTIYTRNELTELSNTCQELGLLLLLDGARLGAALSAEKNDLSLSEIARLTDVFWIGGTKAGALLGEAIVINNSALADDFSFHIKQRGALLAKGRILGLQFRELFKDDLFFEATRHANQLAYRLSTGVTDAGYSLSAETETNQIFPILPNDLIAELQNTFGFYLWGKTDNNHSILRLVTSWATPQSAVDTIVEQITNGGTR